MDFFENIQSLQNHKKTFLCLGLDPNPELFPGGFEAKEQDVFDFCWSILKAVSPWVCAVKPQIAYFSALGFEDVLQQLIRDIQKELPQCKIILDAKRNDIGATAEAYAKEAFERYGVDAVTLNPYMGKDAIEPFLSYEGKAVFVLCRTSNGSAAAVQNQVLANGKPFYLEMANEILSWSTSGNIGLVVGATAPSEMELIVSNHPEAWLLVPGVGSQGGSLSATLDVGYRGVGKGGVIVNSARGILYKGKNQSNYLSCAEFEAKRLQNEMASYFH